MSKIAALLILLLKTTRLSDLASKVFKADDNKIVNDGGNRVNKTVVNLFKNKKSRNLMYIPNIKVTKKPNFLTPNIKKVLNYKQLMFIKALILEYFDLKSHIWIEIDVLGYIISRMLS